MMPHLMIVTGSFRRGGFERRLKYLVEWLDQSQAHLNVTLFFQSRSGPNRPRAGIGKSIYWPSHLFDRCGLTFIHNFLFYILIKLLSKCRPMTLLVGHQSIMAVLAHNKRIINDPDIRVVYCLVNNLEYSPYRKEVYSGLANCDLVIFNSKRHMTTLKNQISELQAVYVPNQISVSNNSPTQRRPLGDGLKLVACGNFATQKNLDLLIPVAKSLEELFVGVELTIFGSGQSMTSFQAKVKDAGVSCIEIIENADFKTFVSGFDLFLLPSLYEGYPNVLLEAQLAGVPSVAFAIDYGPDEIIADSVSGFLVEQICPQAFLQKMLVMIDDLDSFKKGARENAGKLKEKHSDQNTVLPISQLIKAR